MTCRTAPIINDSRCRPRSSSSHSANSV